ncbi:hypothetical protein H8E65_06435 [Candidatus Bathyarchaeota archaeon]|nr:hypothetical protein [Candidatus Bathyarchaeota archaeon]
MCLVGEDDGPGGVDERGVGETVGGVEEEGASSWADVSMGPEKFFDR